MSEEYAKQLDYGILLMNQLNRIGIVTTSNFVDLVNEQDVKKYLDPKSLGEKALSWGCHYLYSIIPDALIDEGFREEQKKYLEISDSSDREFMKLKAIINLLYRKGLLFTESVGGLRKL